MTNKLTAVAAVAVLALAPAQAQSVAELLQKGIYAQESAGDLDGAIQLFRQAINAASSSRALAAQALYHIGAAQAAKGDTGGAAQTLRQLIDQYPEQRDLAARLQQYLPAYKPSSAQAGFTATVYRDPGTSGVSFVLPPGWTASQSEVDSSKSGINIFLNDPANSQVSIIFWVRTEKIDASTLPQTILVRPEHKEAELRSAGIPDFTIRRDTIRPLQVGANKGISVIGDYTSERSDSRAVFRGGQAMVLRRHDTPGANGQAAISNPPVPQKVAMLYSWLWGTNSRVVIFARDLDPNKLSECDRTHNLAGRGSIIWP
jgi:hypothetical protein